VRILDSAAYQDATGEPPPPTPIGPGTYEAYGLPWFELYDEDRGDVPAPDALRAVRPAGGDPDPSPKDPR
jgi:hypothetical protein